MADTHPFKDFDGKRVTFTGRHPWAGFSGRVIKLTTPQLTGGQLPALIVLLDNGTEAGCFDPRQELIVHHNET